MFKSGSVVDFIFYFVMFLFGIIYLIANKRFIKKCKNLPKPTRLLDRGLFYFVIFIDFSFIIIFIDTIINFTFFNSFDYFYWFFYFFIW